MRIVFDLDGTLIDSAPDIRLAVNAMLEDQGLQPLDLPTVVSFIGNGLPHLVRLAMQARDMDMSRHDALADDVIRRYEAVNGKLTQLYPGTTDALNALAEAGHRLAICTNKPEVATKDILRHFNLARLFDRVIGGDSLPQRKPHPAPLLAAFGDEPGLYVGDSEVDAETAGAAGVPFALFTGGYRKTPVEELSHACTFDAFDELPALVPRFAPEDAPETAPVAS